MKKEIREFAQAQINSIVPIILDKAFSREEKENFIRIAIVNTVKLELQIANNRLAQLTKAIQDVRYHIDQEYQTKDELVPANIQAAYEVLDEVMSERQIEIL